MSAVVISEAFLAKIAGWEAMKKARALVEQGAVLSADWSPPLLKGVVQEAGTTYRAGLVIKDTINLENICRCRPSQEWGTICAHSVAIGLHHLRACQPAVPVKPELSRRDGSSASPAAVASPQSERRLRRATAEGRASRPR
ncbi:MAG: hypothetical protein U1G07_06725 [Verrucomicrobiota bacterium]